MPFTAAIGLFQATVEGHLFRKAGTDLSRPGKQDLQTGQIFFPVWQGSDRLILTMDILGPHIGTCSTSLVQCEKLFVNSGGK